jgi:hypothetical protein
MRFWSPPAKNIAVAPSIVATVVAVSVPRCTTSMRAAGHQRSSTAARSVASSSPLAAVAMTMHGGPAAAASAVKRS